MKKRIFSIAVIVTLMAGMTSCGQDESMADVEMQIEDQAADPGSGQDGDGPATPPPAGNN